jgi:hypothetical protein
MVDASHMRTAMCAAAMSRNGYPAQGADKQPQPGTLHQPFSREILPPGCPPPQPMLPAAS